MNQFFSRFLGPQLEARLKNYLINSPVFQHFAVTSSRKMEEISKKAVEEISKKTVDAAKNSHPRVKKATERNPNLQSNVESGLKEGLNSASSWFNRAMKQRLRK